jgi:hypothetical protein
LAQLAVAYTHLLRGNTAGTITLLRRAHAHIGAHAANPPYGIDVAGLIAPSRAGPAAVRKRDSPGLR